MPEFTPQESRNQTVDGNLQNPSDALLILAHAAEDTNSDRANHPESSQEMRASRARQPMVHSVSGGHPSSASDYSPVKDGTLSPRLLEHLLRQYVPVRG